MPEGPWPPDPAPEPEEPDEHAGAEGPGAFGGGPDGVTDRARPIWWDRTDSARVTRGIVWADTRGEPLRPLGARSPDEVGAAGTVRPADGPFSNRRPPAILVPAVWLLAAGAGSRFDGLEPAAEFAPCDGGRCSIPPLVPFGVRPRDDEWVNPEGSGEAEVAEEDWVAGTEPVPPATGSVGVDGREGIGRSGSGITAAMTGRSGCVTWLTAVTIGATVATTGFTTGAAAWTTGLINSTTGSAAVETTSTAVAAAWTTGARAWDATGANACATGLVTVATTAAAGLAALATTDTTGFATTATAVDTGSAAFAASATTPDTGVATSVTTDATGTATGETTGAAAFAASDTTADAGFATSATTEAAGFATSATTVDAGSATSATTVAAGFATSATTEATGSATCETPGYATSDTTDATGSATCETTGSATFAALDTTAATNTTGCSAGVAVSLEPVAGSGAGTDSVPGFVVVGADTAGVGSAAGDVVGETSPATASTTPEAPCDVDVTMEDSRPPDPGGAEPSAQAAVHDDPRSQTPPAIPITAPTRIAMPRSEPRPARDGDRRTNAITPAPRHPRDSPDCKITISRQRTPPTGTSTEIHPDRGRAWARSNTQGGHEPGSCSVRGIPGSQPGARSDRHCSGTITQVNA